MNFTEISPSILLAVVAVLAIASAYFSGSETAMMALNRYRLRHLTEQGHGGARRASVLLARPDRLLGVILIGNNLVNNMAATVATVIGLELFGDTGVALAPIVVTLVFLIFAEVAPKTIAANNPEPFAFASSYLLTPLLRVMYPVVVAVNAVANVILRPFTKGAGEAPGDRLSLDELRTLLRDGARIPKRRQDMLLSVVDLERVTVDHIMVPRAEIVGIDIDDNLSSIVDLIATSQHTRLPVYKGTINNVIGVLHLRRAVRFIQQGEFTKADLIQITREPYFVPQGTPLHTQLFNFQKQKRRIALVVDEYGDVMGIVTLEDILEEIVGEFTTDYAANIPEIHPQPDGTYYIDGSAVLRDINRALGWNLPADGPRTLNGLILEHLEFIPDSNLCLRLGDYLIETLQIQDNRVVNAKVQRLTD
jgi:Mg2+/Co2+ transporter CorB